jgi:hypothetical protein
MINPIDKDKVADNPGLITYPHHIGSVAVKPEDVGKVKSRALSAMQEQTHVQLAQIKKQVELLMDQASEIQKRVELSEKIYHATMSFEPFIGHVYHLYTRGEQEYVLMLIGPEEWGRAKPKNVQFVNSAKLLSDHTWQIVG